VFDTAPQEGLTAALFDWKQIGASVVISGEQLFKNSGASKIVSLMETKVRQADISFRKDVNRQALADGTGAGGKEIGGLDLLVEDGSASWSTVGGISSTTNTFWRNQFLDFDGTYTSFQTVGSGQKTTEGMQALRGMWTDCTRQTDKPNLILTSADVYNSYIGLAEGHHARVTLSPETRRLIDLGFSAAEFNGAPIVWDDGIAADDLFMLNTKFLHFVVGSGRNFAMSPFVEPYAQDARIAKILLYCNMTTSGRQFQGRMIDVVV